MKRYGDFSDDALARGDAMLAIERAIADAIEHRTDALAYTPVQAERLLDDTLASRSGAERVEDARVGAAFAERMARKLRARRVGAALQTLDVGVTGATIVGRIAEVSRSASRAGCAPWAETLAVAAGAGRVLDDEACERWLRLPAELRGKRCVAIGVRGDSMEPYLRSGEAVVIDTNASVTVDALVVARTADDGYVVKHATRVSPRFIELSSFNPSYAPFTIARGPGVVAGVVVGKFDPRML